MAYVRIEFDYQGQTYTVEPASLYQWNIYAVSNMREKISFETDLRTGQRIFVDWSNITVFRLVSAVDSAGNPVGPPMNAAATGGAP